jgi:hypothetical protein
MIRVYVEGVGLRGPGLDGWAASLPVLSGAVPYQSAPVRVAASEFLPANERRRAVQTVKIALAVGAEAFAESSRDAAEIATIFASSGGDGETIDAILNVLAAPDREISPTRFHNSVHNAPAGYWSIATGSRAPSSSICAHDGSFAAGLLEAAAQAVTEQRAVALIGYDISYPAPLSLVRPIGAAFAVALVLVPALTEAAIAGLEILLRTRGEASVMEADALDALRRNTPAARSLPLLAALARPEAADVSLDYLDGMTLDVKVSPI